MKINWMRNVKMAPLRHALFTVCIYLITELLFTFSFKLLNAIYKKYYMKINLHDVIANKRGPC